jgi:hypothetical protein
VSYNERSPRVNDKRYDDAFCALLLLIYFFDRKKNAFSTKKRKEREEFLSMLFLLVVVVVVVVFYPKTHQKKKSHRPTTLHINLSPGGEKIKSTHTRKYPRWFLRGALLSSSSFSLSKRVFSVNKRNRERESFFDATFSEREEIHRANHVDDEDDGGGTRDEE